jgi:hypothetical protein
MEREAGTDLEGAADGGDDGGGEVGSRDDGHLPVTTPPPPAPSRAGP